MNTKYVLTQMQYRFAVIYEAPRRLTDFCFKDKLSDGVEADNARTPQKKPIISNKKKSSRIER